MLKNVLLGAVGGGALAAVLAAVATGLMMASDSHSGEYAAVAGVLSGPFGAGLGAIAGGLAERRTPRTIGLICGGLGLGVGTFVCLSLVAMVRGNWVMGLLAMAVGAGGGFCVGAAVGRWRRPQPA